MVYNHVYLLFANRNRGENMGHILLWRWRTSVIQSRSCTHENLSGYACSEPRFDGSNFFGVLIATRNDNATWNGRNFVDPKEENTTRITVAPDCNRTKNSVDLLHNRFSEGDRSNMASGPKWNQEAHYLCKRP